MDVLRTAILEMMRVKKEEHFDPSEVVKQMYPIDWKFFLTEVHAEMMNMYRENLLTVYQDGIPINPNSSSQGKVSIGPPN